MRGVGAVRLLSDGAPLPATATSGVEPRRSPRPLAASSTTAKANRDTRAELPQRPRIPLCTPRLAMRDQEIGLEEPTDAIPHLYHSTDLDRW